MTTTQMNVANIMRRERCSYSRALEIMAELKRDAEAAKKTHGECTWRVDDDGNYATDCGEMHIFISGGPKENRHSFCPYCGGALKL